VKRLCCRVSLLKSMKDSLEKLIVVNSAVRFKYSNMNRTRLKDDRVMLFIVYRSISYP
jgi:hypothetical protein